MARVRETFGAFGSASWRRIRGKNYIVIKQNFKILGFVLVILAVVGVFLVLSNPIINLLK